jgi:hypothetical protein
MKKVLRVFKWIGITIGAFLVFFTGYFYYSLATAEARVRPMCAEIKPGTARTEIQTYAIEKGLLIPAGSSNSNVVFAVEKRSYGRFGCKILFDGEVVKTSEYMHND